MPSSSDSKLKILCLHGYRQNGTTFREKTGSFRKVVKKYAELVYIDAPHTVCEEQGGPVTTSQQQEEQSSQSQNASEPTLHSAHPSQNASEPTLPSAHPSQNPPGSPKNESQQHKSVSTSSQHATNISQHASDPSQPDILNKTGPEQPQQRQGSLGWWFSRADNYYKASQVSECCKGFQESVELVRRVFKEQGPFDGILGFSQGASFLSLLCMLRSIDDSENPLQFRFAIFFAGFKSQSLAHLHLYTESQPADLPTLHVIGRGDQTIGQEMCEELLPYFLNPTVLRHDGGHFVPSHSTQKPVYADFLQRMLTSKS